MLKRLIAAVKDEEGASLVEYALLLALVAVASIAVLTTLGTDIGLKIGEVNTELEK